MAGLLMVLPSDLTDWLAGLLAVVLCADACFRAPRPCSSSPPCSRAAAAPHLPCHLLATAATPPHAASSPASPAQPGWPEPC